MCINLRRWWFNWIGLDWKKATTKKKPFSILYAIFNTKLSKLAMFWSDNLFTLWCGEDDKTELRASGSSFMPLPIAHWLANKFVSAFLPHRETFWLSNYEDPRGNRYFHGETSLFGFHLVRTIVLFGNRSAFMTHLEIVDWH